MTRRNCPKWTFLEHNGPWFPPAYKPLPKFVHIIYNGRKIQLSERAEEVATLYAKLLHKECINDNTFNRNFFKDWRRVMLREEREIIEDLKKCDFRRIHLYFSNPRYFKNQDLQDDIDTRFKYCIKDGYYNEISNYVLPLPKLFEGRGKKNRCRGKLQKRILPEDIIINCSNGSKVPVPYKGQCWKDVVNNSTVNWLACWTDSATGQLKYMNLHRSTKTEIDKNKFENARKLHEYLPKIRETYFNDLNSNEKEIQQKAVALYLIDELALRAGNKLKKNKRGTTYGCCTLQVRHIEFIDSSKFIIKLDFLGKSSVRFSKQCHVRENVYKNLKLFVDDKKKTDDLFEAIDASKLNNYLKTITEDENMSIKVFRTYKACSAFEKKLKDYAKPKVSFKENILSYLYASDDIKRLCNHTSLITSKQNYLDPCITVAWCKNFYVPIENIYNDEELMLFKWAFGVDRDYEFLQSA